MEKVLTVTQAAHRLNLSAQRVRQLADAGRLPVERGPLGIRLFDSEAIERFAQERDRGRQAAR